MANLTSTPISSYKTYLLKGTESGDDYSWEKLCDIKSAPELGGTPERLETTTLSNANRTYIPGIKDFGESEFSLNYVPSEYSALSAGEGVSGHFAVALGYESGEAGADGIWQFDGKYYLSKDSAEVNAVHGATLTMYIESDFKFSTTAVTVTISD